ncbi:MAG: hypothetical protein ABEJ74_00185 [Haloferacaceae archaeon]
MECPRCGGVLTTFTLGEARAVVCESCEYVGVPIDHQPPPGEEGESWDEVLERHRRRAKRSTENRSDDGPSETSDATGDRTGNGS